MASSTHLIGAGVLRHSTFAFDVNDVVERASHDTSARIRGDLVRQLSLAGTRYGAEWTSVHDVDRQLVLDLSNPFETEERWRECSPGVVDETFRAQDDEIEFGDGTAEHGLYAIATRVIVARGQASVSILQCRLGIGLSRMTGRKTADGLNPPS